MCDLDKDTVCVILLSQQIAWWVALIFVYGTYVAIYLTYMMLIPTYNYILFISKNTIPAL